VTAVALVAPPDATVIREAIAAMRADPDPRWHAVADLLATSPLNYARLPGFGHMAEARSGAAVARAYLADLAAAGPLTEGA
jgi:hypothetical protein